MIIVENIPSEIQVPKHSSETESLSFSLFGAEGELFTTDVLEVDGLHYRVLIDKEIKEGAYRYQIQKDNHIIEMGLLKYKQTPQTNEVHGGQSDVAVFYE